MADDQSNLGTADTASSADPAPVSDESSHPRRPRARWLYGLLAVSLVVLLAAATFAWIRAGERDSARRTQRHALEALRKQRSATTTARAELSRERKQISTFEQRTQVPLASAKAGMAVLDQLDADAHALQAAGLNLGTPEAENAYNEVLARVQALADPLNAALNPFPGQITTLRTEFPALPAA